MDDSRFLRSPIEAQGYRSENPGQHPDRLSERHAPSFVAADGAAIAMKTGTWAPDQGWNKPPNLPSELTGDLHSKERQLDILLTWRDRVGLFKSSCLSSSARMPWQLLSVTSPGSYSSFDDELLECVQLLHRGTGLTLRDILTIRSGPTVELSDGPKSTSHSVYVVETNQRRLALGPGYSVYRWVKRPRVGRFDGSVDWLAPILKAAAPKRLKPLSPVHAWEAAEFL
jgi:hypothetical protein